MGQLGNGSVANQANTSDGYAQTSPTRPTTPSAIATVFQIG